jgi:NADH-quinone oxidoreductase subunit L
MAVAAIVTAVVLYLRKPDLPKRIAQYFDSLYAIVERKYGFDELYSRVFAGGTRRIGRGFWRGGDQTVIDGLIVNGSARVVGWFAGVIRHIQSGLLNQYAVAMLFGLLILTFWLLR